MESVKKWIYDNKVNLIIIFIYACFSFIIVSFHESWRDESQAWLMAQLNPLDLIRSIKTEGHMILWFLILMPFAKLGFPYVTIKFISWFIVCVSSWLILKFAPFKTYKKCLFICMPTIFYSLAAVSRCYCLVLLCVCLTAIFYKDRETKPFRYLFSVVLLANTHTLSLGFAGVLFLEFFIETVLHRKNLSSEQLRRIVFAFVMVAILMILSILPFFINSSTNAYISNHLDIGKSLNSLITVQPINLIFSAFNISKNFVFYYIVLLAIAFAFIVFKNYRKTFFEIFISILWQLVVCSFVYNDWTNQKAAISICIVFFFWWVKPFKKIKYYEKIISSVVLINFMILNIIFVSSLVFKDISGLCSCAYQVGDFINESVEDNSIMMTGEGTHFTGSIIPYVDKSKNISFYSIPQNKFFTYTVWDTANTVRLSDSSFDNLNEIFRNNETLYYLLTLYEVKYGVNMNYIQPLIDNGSFEEVFRTGLDYGSNESFIVYKVHR